MSCFVVLYNFLLGLTLSDKIRAHVSLFVMETLSINNATKINKTLEKYTYANNLNKQLLTSAALDISGTNSGRDNRLPRSQARVDVCLSDGAGRRAAGGD